MGMSGLPDIYTRSPRAEGVYSQANHECPWYNYYVTLPCTNCAWVSTKQLKPYS